jgi:hypothetical protein
MLQPRCSIVRSPRLNRIEVDFSVGIRLMTFYSLLVAYPGIAITVQSDNSNTVINLYYNMQIIVNYVAVCMTVLRPEVLSFIVLLLAFRRALYRDITAKKMRVNNFGSDDPI